MALIFNFFEHLSVNQSLSNFIFRFELKILAVKTQVATNSILLFISNILVLLVGLEGLWATSTLKLTRNLVVQR